MSRLSYWHVDAFAERPFAGNQAAVMPLDAWLPDDMLRAIAAENMFAETAYVVRDTTGEADWELRWFTPAVEARMCGHATLASGHVLLGRDGGERVTFRTRKAGVLEVRRIAAGYELALPVIAAAPEPFPDAVAALGSEPHEVWRGVGHYQFICTAPGDRTDIVSRMFAPGAGIDEDSVTGSAHAVLAPFWATRLGRNSFTAHQASARGGDLSCRLEGDQVWLGGHCVTVVEGTFYLSG
jgi:predicted PhzF superfamily epimerase YddE/YHI9